MVMEDEKKSKSENGDVWKNIIKEVKEESPKSESIEKKPATKQEPKTQDSIENKAIEKPIEKPKEETKPEEKQEEKPEQKATKSKNAKFTTIMLTKELKQKLKDAKDPHESYGDYIKKLLEK